MSRSIHATDIELPTFLKWAGGKRRLITLIESSFPENIDRYFEPFLGGGSMFFYVKQKFNPAECLISDINPDLINLYRHVRDEPDSLIKSLKQFRSKHSKDNYYEVRGRFNSDYYRPVQRSAAFIYLNKTCFNGLYRVNSKNKFNVPFGDYATPSIFDEKTIHKASELLQNGVRIEHCDYRDIVDEIKLNDFIYLDPCYDPIKKTSFTNYTPNKFSKEDREKLFSFIETLRRKKAHVVLSNNDIPEIRKLYSSYTIKEIDAPRYIGSKTSYRKAITELVISI